MVEKRAHVADGIEEYDNPLPRWWVYLFAFSIVFGVVYAVLYPSSWFWGGALDWSSSGQYDRQVAQAAVAFSDAGASIDLEALSHQPEVVAQGREIFVKNCVICHGEHGEGKIGPRLYGPTWRFGGDSKTMLQTIRFGRPAGMPAWSKQGMTLESISRVGAYVFSLRYTAPTNPAGSPPPSAPTTPQSGLPATPIAR